MVSQPFLHSIYIQAPGPYNRSPDPEQVCAFWGARLGVGKGDLSDHLAMQGKSISWIYSNVTSFLNKISFTASDTVLMAWNIIVTEDNQTNIYRSQLHASTG
jgi:hypothetical protein